MARWTAAIILWAIGLAIAVFGVSGAFGSPDLQTSLRMAAAGIVVASMFGLMGWQLRNAKGADE